MLSLPSVWDPQFVRDTIDGIVKLYETHISPFITSVSDGISTIISAVLDGYNDNIKPVLDTVGKDVKNLYDEYVKPIMDKIALNSLENKKLSELRDSLLPKLMNGEIDLDNIEV